MDLNKNIITDAKTLKRHDRDFADLSKIANSVLSRLAEAIHEAHAAGKSRLSFSVPNFLQVDGFSNKTSQLYIFTAILKLLEEKSYRASIKIGQAESVIRVTWESEEDLREIKNLHAYLKTRAMDICQE